MERISVDDTVVKNHVTVMEDCSDQLRRDEQDLGLTADLNAPEPFSVTDPGVRLESGFSDAVESYEGALAVMGDELLVMARRLTQLVGEVTAVDQDLADRLRAIADGIDGGAPPTVPPVTTVPGAPRSTPPVSVPERPVLEALPARIDLGTPGDRTTPIAPEQEAQA